MFRTWLIALSFANLLYLGVWRDLLIVSERDQFFQKRLPMAAQYAAAGFDVLVVSFLVLAVLLIAARMPRAVRVVLLYSGLVLAVVAARTFASGFLPVLRSEILRYVTLRNLAVVVALSALILLILTVRYYESVLSGAELGVVVLTPCLFVTLGGAGWRVLSARDAPHPAGTLAPRYAQTSAHRVLWLIFDEWDQHLAFVERPPGLRLPVLDALRGESFVADRALGPERVKPVSHMATAVAMPSLIYGKTERTARLDGKRLKLTFEDGSTEVFGAGRSLFSRAREQHWNAAIGGWYLPYCPAFQEQLTDCYWDQMYRQGTSVGPSFQESIWEQPRSLFETTSFSLFKRSLVAERHREEYAAILEFARRMTADAQVSLALFHFNIPHAPHFSFDSSGTGTYEGGLELVDQTVGQILQTLKAAGLADRTALVLSSDHPLRTSKFQDIHVPFLVHLPGEIRATVYRKEFSTLLTSDLIMELLQAKLQTPEALGEFIGNQ